MGESEWRTRSQVLVDDILIDFPPEAYFHSLKHGVDLSNIENLLVTHSHMDHFYAHDFILRGYKYAKLSGGKLNIYGTNYVKEVFDECTKRELREDVAPNLEFHEIKEFEEIFLPNARVLTIPAQHSKVETCLLYYIEIGQKGYLHLNDTGRLNEDCYKFLSKMGAKVDLVSFDCTFVNAVAGSVSRHMGILDDMTVKEKLISYGICGDNTKYVITHFSHNANPLKENLKSIERQFGVIAAYDGMEFEV